MNRERLHKPPGDENAQTPITRNAKIVKGKKYSRNYAYRKYWEQHEKDKLFQSIYENLHSFELYKQDKTRKKGIFWAWAVKTVPLNYYADHFDDGEVNKKRLRYIFYNFNKRNEQDSRYKEIMKIADENSPERSKNDIEDDELVNFVYKRLHKFFVEPKGRKKVYEYMKEELFSHGIEIRQRTITDKLERITSKKDLGDDRISKRIRKIKKFIGAYCKNYEPKEKLEFISVLHDNVMKNQNSKKKLKLFQICKADFKEKAHLHIINEHVMKSKFCSLRNNSSKSFKITPDVKKQIDDIANYVQTTKDYLRPDVKKKYDWLSSDDGITSDDESDYESHESDDESDGSESGLLQGKSQDVDIERRVLYKEEHECAAGFTGDDPTDEEGTNLHGEREGGYGSKEKENYYTGEPSRKEFIIYNEDVGSESAGNLIDVDAMECDKSECSIDDEKGRQRGILIDDESDYERCESDSESDGESVDESGLLEKRNQDVDIERRVLYREEHECVAGFTDDDPTDEEGTNLHGKRGGGYGSKEKENYYTGEPSRKKFVIYNEDVGSESAGNLIDEDVMECDESAYSVDDEKGQQRRVLYREEHECVAGFTDDDPTDEEGANLLGERGGA